MNQFESQVVAIPYSQQRVYDMLSDLSHLEAVKDRIPQDKVKELKFDSDTVSINVAPVGDIAFKIIEREECILRRSGRFFLWHELCENLYLFRSDYGNFIRVN